jgi:hypothetical protein
VPSRRHPVNRHIERSLRTLITRPGLRHCPGPFALFALENRMKTRIIARKPRNPLVAAARFRRAGTHEAHGGSQRQQSRRALRRELEQLSRPKPSP